MGGGGRRRGRARLATKGGAFEAGLEWHGLLPVRHS
jgi:hypothetical protein